MKRKKVVVAMSGGVDSSVAAALLKKEGFDVIGVYMKNWSPESLMKVIKKKTPALRSLISQCPSEKDARDARSVAFKLGIPFYVFNFEKEYRENVIEYFFNEYRSGRTPNPDILCNLKIKFGHFFKKALEMGADYIATGHYGRVVKEENRYKLFKAVDPQKDQSYFLWTLKENRLKRILLPIGVYTKQEVRQLARDFGLPTAEKADSQGICFVGEIDVIEFLKTRLPEKPGQVITTKGENVGTHQGAWFYTQGQRQGVGSGGGGIPLYVVGKNIKDNTLIVGGAADPKLFSSTLKAEKLNWIRKVPHFPIRCQASIRYRQAPAPALIEKTGSGEVLVTFKYPQRAVTPGQSIVFYSGEEALGGGIIKEAVK